MHTHRNYIVYRHTRDQISRVTSNRMTASGCSNERPCWDDSRRTVDGWLDGQRCAASLSLIQSTDDSSLDTELLSLVDDSLSLSLSLSDECR